MKNKLNTSKVMIYGNMIMLFVTAIYSLVFAVGTACMKKDLLMAGCYIVSLFICIIGTYLCHKKGKIYYIYLSSLISWLIINLSEYLLLKPYYFYCFSAFHVLFAVYGMFGLLEKKNSQMWSLILIVFTIALCAI